MLTELGFLPTGITTPTIPTRKLAPGTDARTHSHFELDDADREWTYQSVRMWRQSAQWHQLTLTQEVFDFIHIRNVSQGISDWPKVLSEAFR